MHPSPTTGMHSNALTAAGVNTAWQLGTQRTMSLWNFIARAVKGDKPKGSPRSEQGRGFAPAAFARSMFFVHLYQEHRCEVWEGPWLALRHITQMVLYEGLECFECNAKGIPMLFDETCIAGM